MKIKTLKTKIKDLPTTGPAAGFVRQLAGASNQKFRDAHRCLVNFKEDAGSSAAPDTRQAIIHCGEQRKIVDKFVENFGDLTVEQFLNKK